MSIEEITISELQNRVKYLEAHLHLTLQVLNALEKDSTDIIQNCDKHYNHANDRTIEITPTNKVGIPTFLNARTWKLPLDTPIYNSSDICVSTSYP